MVMCQSRKNHKEQISIVKDTVHKKFLEFPLKETQGIFFNIFNCGYIICYQIKSAQAK